jgi:hypothetical protein
MVFSKGGFNLQLSLEPASIAMRTHEPEARLFFVDKKQTLTEDIKQQTECLGSYRTADDLQSKDQERCSKSFHFLLNRARTT